MTQGQTPEYTRRHSTMDVRFCWINNFYDILTCILRYTFYYYTVSISFLQLYNCTSMA